MMHSLLLTLSVAAPVIWTLAFVALAALAMAGLVIWKPGVFTKGQDAAGKGMMTGCAVAALGAFALVISVINAILTAASAAPLDTATRVAGFGPLLGLLLAGLAAFLAVQLRRGR